MSDIASSVSENFQLFENLSIQAVCIKTYISGDKCEFN